MSHKELSIHEHIFTCTFHSRSFHHAHAQCLLDCLKPFPSVLQYLAKLHAICVVWSVSSPVDYNSTLNQMLKLSNNADNRSSGIYSASPNFYLIMTTLVAESNANKSVNIDEVSPGEEWMETDKLYVDLGAAIDFGCQVSV